MSQFENCLERVIRSIQTCKKSAQSVGPHSRLEEDLDIDSLDVLMLVGELEEEFDIDIDGDHLDGVVTVGDIVTRLEELPC